MNRTEAAKDGNALHFRIGRDHTRQWVVVEAHGLYGGIFTTQDAAVRYVRFECGKRSQDPANDGRGTWDIVAEPVELALPSRAGN